MNVFDFSALEPDDKIFVFLGPGRSPREARVVATWRQRPELPTDMVLVAAAPLGEFRVERDRVGLRA